MVGVETILCDPGFGYEFILDDANVAAGATLLVDNSAGMVGVGGLTLHGEDETDGKFILLGGAGGDHLVGGAMNDKVYGGADTTGNILGGGGGKDTVKGSPGDDSIIGGFGADKITPGAGADVLMYMVPPHSTGASYDKIKGFDFATMDKFDMPGPVIGVAPPVPGGSLSKATFEADMAAAVGPPMLPMLNAVIFTPTMGTLAGKTFLGRRRERRGRLPAGRARLRDGVDCTGEPGCTRHNRFHLAASRKREPATEAGAVSQPCTRVPGLCYTFIHKDNGGRRGEAASSGDRAGWV
jgi:RTX calcium-binding nonapeptide repeat (4 copies)